MSTPFAGFHVGSYTREGGVGITAVRFDAVSGGMERTDETPAPDPSFLARHPSRPWIYATHELREFEGSPTGAVSAYEVAPSGALRLLGRQPSGGRVPAHIAVHPGGRHAVVANYRGPTVCIFPIATDGALQPASDRIEYSGSGPNGLRQEAAHPHCARFDPSGRLLVVTDLGTDRVWSYRFDGTTGRLSPAPQSNVSVEPGAGPRHLAFHPTAPWCWVLNEMAATVTTFGYSADHGLGWPRRHADLLPPEFAGPRSGAEIAVHPSGRWLYGSNRGHDSISVFAIETASGRLAPVGRVHAGGATPRHFALSPDGRFLLVACQQGHVVHRLRIDPDTGLPAGDAPGLAVTAPCCICFAPPP
jgi:6-phosphogluconolactonase